ncbi:3-oxo-5-alpha-steroid 4-dehydrogenase-domain-containing protein [Lipomyces oligophaga]|uniref:3-oxo-5-alpha-steroid 4-dehydrogenase-domain-containing protein n=1 Tax=Lipomyces oligophaga TaxID=45792 RepID=UPI0034CE525A
MVTVNIRTKSPKAKISRLPSTLEVDSKSTVESLVEALSGVTKLGTERLRLTLIDNTRLIPGTPLEKYDLQDNSIVYVKDLGPQVSWATVFYIEYAGPIFIHLLLYNCQALFYGRTYEHSLMQKTLLIMVLIHYLKRELETLFVHRFSNASMPFLYIFRNSSHYWFLSGVLLGYFSYKPDTRTPLPPAIYYSLVGLWIYAETSNFVTHLILSSLRPKGTTQRKIPFGYGFNLVSCPNYFFESLSWLAVVGITRTWSAALFWLVSTVTMYQWALKKHSKYKREFPGKYPKSRKAIFPYIA